MNLYQHLSRVMTKGRDFVPQIDGLRFVAITAVLAYHIRAIIAWHYGISLDTPAGTDGLVNWTFGAGCKGVELFLPSADLFLACRLRANISVRRNLSGLKIIISGG